MKINQFCNALRDLRAWARSNPGEILYIGDGFYCKSLMMSNAFYPDLLICSARSYKDAERFFNQTIKNVRECE